MSYIRVCGIAVALSLSLVSALMPMARGPVATPTQSVVQPFRPASTQIMTPAPMASAPAIMGGAITPLASTTTAVAGGDIKNSIRTFQQLFASFNTTTPVATLQQYITQFLSTVVTVAQTSSTISVDDMNSVKMLIDQLVSVLANINSSLANRPDEAQKRAMITSSSTNLRTQSTQLGQKLEKNKKITMQLTQIRSVSNTQFSLKLSQYTSLLSQMDASIVEPVKATLVTDLSGLMTYAQTAKGTELNTLKQFLTKAQAVASFSPQIKAQLASVAAGQAPVMASVGGVPGIAPATMPATQQTAGQTTLVLSGAATPADAVFQAKLKEVNARASIIDKISGAQELLVLAGQTPSQSMKNSIITLVNQIFSSPATMTSTELTAIHGLLVKLQQQQFLLSQNQRPAVDSWVKLCEQALPFAAGNQPLLPSVKACLTQYQQNYSKAIQAASLTMKLLATKLVPQEVDKNNIGGLVGILRQNLVSYYNARANKSLDDLKALLDLLSLAAKRSNLVDVIQKRWIDSLNLTVALTTAEGQKTVLDKVKAYDTASAMLQGASDRSDKSRLLDGLNSLFVNRKDFAQAEVGALQALLNKLLSPAYKRKAVFDSVQTAQLTTMLNVLNATNALLTARSTELTPKIAALTKAMPLIDLKTMGYEQQLFVGSLNDLFAVRGDMVRGELAQIATFFTQVTQQGQKTGTLLTPDQLATLAIWTQEEQYAQSVATADKSFLAALIDQCAQTKNLQLVHKALTLFTKNTTSSVKSAFATMLEGLFAARKTLNPTDLQNLLKAVDAQKLVVLPPEKRDNPSSWLQTITRETTVAATQKTAAARQNNDYRFV